MTRRPMEEEYALKLEEMKKAAYKVIGKLETGKVRVCVFEIDNHQLLVLVCREQQR